MNKGIKLNMQKSRICAPCRRNQHHSRTRCISQFAPLQLGVFSKLTGRNPQLQRLFLKKSKFTIRRNRKIFPKSKTTFFDKLNSTKLDVQLVNFFRHGQLSRHLFLNLFSAQLVQIEF